jgi:predicted transcriptional regulator
LSAVTTSEVIEMSRRAITIRTDDETIARLDRLAKASGRSRNILVNEALKVFLQDQAWQIEAIRDGMRSLDGGGAVPHEQVIDEISEKIHA